MFGGFDETMVLMISKPVLVVWNICGRLEKIHFVQAPHGLHKFMNLHSLRNLALGCMYVLACCSVEACVNCSAEK